MSYKRYFEQVQEHLNFLRSKGFYITDLKVNAGFVRCTESGLNQSRGELAYKTTSKLLNNGLTGLQTWFRGPGGETDRFLTYGLGLEGQEIQNLKLAESLTVQTLKQSSNSDCIMDQSQYDEAGRKAYGFWQHSELTGSSAYLEKKQVGHHGIRFRSTEQYGTTAIIPMNDRYGRLWNYQILNRDGSKRHPKNARIEGLFHKIGIPVNGSVIGLAESYVTSSSCYELTGIPVICAFSSQNLKAIALIVRDLYPISFIAIFADNDRHLEIKGEPNQGLIKAQEALRALGKMAVVIEPTFGEHMASKETTDWNDLIRQKGLDFAKAQLKEKLNNVL